MQFWTVFATAVAPPGVRPATSAAGAAASCTRDAHLQLCPDDAPVAPHPSARSLVRGTNAAVGGADEREA